MGELQRDFTPEYAAQRLRGCSDVHYLDRATETETDASPDVTFECTPMTCTSP